MERCDQEPVIQQRWSDRAPLNFNRVYALGKFEGDRCPFVPDTGTGAIGSEEALGACAREAEEEAALSSTMRGLLMLSNFAFRSRFSSISFDAIRKASRGIGGL